MQLAAMHRKLLSHATLTSPALDQLDFARGQEVGARCNPYVAAVSNRRLCIAASQNKTAHIALATRFSRVKIAEHRATAN